ncbi:MAG TPA: hypothetical protein VHU15_01890 [Stellaceae bacterium]|nr:hypothetical protein [Stellaceae bacterium]
MQQALDFALCSLEFELPGLEFGDGFENSERVQHGKRAKQLPRAPHEVASAACSS